MTSKPTTWLMIMLGFFVTPLPTQSAETGFLSIFDGKSLKGWRAVPANSIDDWSVRDGVILGAGSENRLSYLVWGDEKLGDFELKFSYRMVTKGNSGVEIRARVDKTGKRPFEGYHADFGHVGIGPQVLGAWDFHFARRREPPCPLGTRLVIDPDGKTHSTRIPGAVTTADLNKHKWNHVHVIARGQHFLFFLNGKLASEFTDNFSGLQLNEGAIGLQLHDKGMKVEFKDVQLKKLSRSSPADRAVVYVSAARDHKLVTYDLDLRSGALKATAEVALEGAPGAQALHPDGEVLYVSIRSAKSVAALRRNPQTGSLTLLRTTPIGTNSAYVAVDRTGSWLLSASYSDGKVSSHAIENDGRVGKAVSVVETSRCAHAILADLANRFVLVPHTCPNAVYQFQFDAQTGRLVPNDPPQVSPAAGLEPRHLAFHPTLDVVYFDDEKGSSVTAYRYEAVNGNVAPFQTTSTLPAEFTARNSCADIEITTDGRFVYASNRGHNSIAGFSVDPGTGKLTSIGQFPTGDTPRSFNLAPGGKWLVAAGQRSNDLTTYRRDPQTGKLEKLKVYPTGKNPSWVQIVRLNAGKKTVRDATGDNWPRFRGPGATGVAADDPRLPDRWSTTENVAWKTDIPGWGWASPVVWGHRVFLTSVASESEYEKPKKGLYLGGGRPKPPKGVHLWLTFCLDINTGKVLWKREAHKGEPRSPRHPKSTYASETPTTDGERVYVLFGDVGLYCYDMRGTPIWSHPIDPKETFYGYGAAASPVLAGNQLIMIYDNQEESYIASFDTKTGKQNWRTPRDEKSTWATPFVWSHALRTEIVACGKRRIRSYDLAGNVLWELSGRMSNLVIPSPFASHGMVYIASGYIGDRHRPVFAVKPGATGDITPENKEFKSEFIAWYQPKASPYNTSPIIYRDLYYTVLDRGFMTCHEAKTGAEVYGKTRFPLGSSFTSSPWAYNGKVFCLTEEGDTHVLQAGREFKLLHTNRLDELCMASPAVCQGKLLLRTASKLYCISNVR